MDNYFTDIIGKGVTFPIQLSRNENGETGWYPVNGDTAVKQILCQFLSC